ncbi:MAG: NACHT domain-containing protein, partial [Candidatus Thorarchaeota archaeon]
MDWKGFLKKAGKGIVIAAASVVAGITLGPIAASAIGSFMTKKMAEMGITASSNLIEYQIQDMVMDAPGSIAGIYDSHKMKKISEKVASETGVGVEEVSVAVQYALRELQTTMSGVVEELQTDRNLMAQALQLAQETDEKIDTLTDISRTTQDAIEEVRLMLRSMERGLDASYRDIVGAVSERSMLSSDRILILGKLQRQNTTLSSRFDVKYDPDLYVSRKKDEAVFEGFMSSAGMTDRNVFLVLGDVGMGKTWFLSRLSALTIEANAPTFFVPLRHGIRSLTGVFNVQTLSELINLFDSILTPDRKHAYIFLDGLDEMPSREVRSILSAISAARVGSVSFILSCRCTDWISDSIIVQGAHDLEYYIYDDAAATQAGRARGASSSISVLMSEFNEEEMIAAIERYGFPEEIPEGMSTFLRKPFLCRLLSRKYAQTGVLPSPNSREFLDLFAGEEDQAHTILGRLGVLTQRDALYATVEQFIETKEETMALSELRELDPDDPTFRTLVSSGLLNLMVTRYGSAISLSWDYMVPLLTLTIMRYESRPAHKKELLDSLKDWIPHLAPKVIVLVEQVEDLHEPIEDVDGIEVSTPDSAA